MEQHINSYQGMNKDTAYDSIAPTFYIDALDIRITTTNGESLGGFTNVKGNRLAFEIPVGGDFNSVAWTASYPVIIGYATIRTRIILFVADDSDEKGWIYDIQYNPATSTTSPILIQIRRRRVKSEISKPNMARILPTSAYCFPGSLTICKFTQGV